jgi:hypothetical protein
MGDMTTTATPETDLWTVSVLAGDIEPGDFVQRRGSKDGSIQSWWEAVTAVRHEVKRDRDHFFPFTTVSVLHGDVFSCDSNSVIEIRSEES